MNPSIMEIEMEMTIRNKRDTSKLNERSQESKVGLSEGNHRSHPD